MKALLTITDLTRMRGQRICVAGYLPDGTCIRPVLRMGNLMEDWLCVDRQVIVRPFAVVELDLQERVPKPPHTEDCVINPAHRVSRGMLSQEQRKIFLTRIVDPSVERIFGAPIHSEHGSYIAAGEGERSLGTVQPRRIWEVCFGLGEEGKWEYRIAFTDQAGKRYRLAVTDLAFRYYLDHLRVREKMAPEQVARLMTDALQKAQTFLRIGLARPTWEKYPNRCYLQITGVYSFPDYLDGRCFADFTPSPGEAT